MGTMELSRKVSELRELRRMAEELAAEIEGIQDAIKSYMAAQGIEELTGTDYRISWKEVTTVRLDGKALKAAAPELAARFTRETTTRRFCVA